LAGAQHLDGLGDSLRPGGVSLGLADPADELLAVRIRQCLERRPCLGIVLASRSGSVTPLTLTRTGRPRASNVKVKVRISAITTR
jgi:hypothetical protein